MQQGHGPHARGARPTQTDTGQSGQEGGREDAQRRTPASPRQRQPTRPAHWPSPRPPPSTAPARPHGTPTPALGGGYRFLQMGKPRRREGRWLAGVRQRVESCVLINPSASRGRWPQLSVIPHPPSLALLGPWLGSPAPVPSPGLTPSSLSQAQGSGPPALGPLLPGTGSGGVKCLITHPCFSVCYYYYFYFFPSSPSPGG